MNPRDMVPAGGPDASAAKLDVRVVNNGCVRALEAEVARLREVLTDVHRRVQDQTGNRTFDDCSRDLMHADALCRRALTPINGNAPPEDAPNA